MFHNIYFRYFEYHTHLYIMSRTVSYTGIIYNQDQGSRINFYKVCSFCIKESKG